MGRSLQYSGVAAVATIWVSLTAATVFVGFDLFGEHPISYLGTSSGPPWLFTVGLLVSALLLAVFHGFVRGRYPVGLGFSFVMLAGLGGQTVAAFVPIGGEAGTHRIHTTSALVLGASLPLLMWRFAAAQPPGRWRRLAYRIFFAEALACAVGLYLSGHGIAPVAEILPAAIFHIWVVVVTFAAGGSRLPSGDGAGVRRYLLLRSGAGAGDARLRRAGHGGAPWVAFVHRPSRVRCAPRRSAPAHGRTRR